MRSKAIHSLEDLKQWVKEFTHFLGEKDLILLEGPMGAGKSQLVKFLVAELGGKETFSPSFSIHNRYELSHGRHIDHVDLYRVDSDDDLISTGFWDFFDQEKSLFCIEWADRFDSEVYSSDWNQHWIQIQMDDQQNRNLSYRFQPKI